MVTVLFVCTRNAGRSQIATAFFNRLADPTKGYAISAGMEPAGELHPIVIAAMREEGIDLSGERPTRLTPALATRANLLVAMAGREAQRFGSGVEVLNWDLPDSKDLPLEEVRALRDDIKQCVTALVHERQLT